MDTLQQIMELHEIINSLEQDIVIGWFITAIVLLIWFICFKSSMDKIKRN